jgi:hypothetical protein
MPLPAKFDDLKKTAHSVLGDDYEVKGKKLEAKVKTNLSSAVSTTLIEFGEGEVKTPAKLTWKFPKLFNLAGLSLDKFEFDQKGKSKVECGLKKDLHKVDGLAIDVKTELGLDMMPDFSKVTAGFAYTGIKDAVIKIETKPMKVQEVTAEGLYGIGALVIGAKFSPEKKVDVGCNITQGQMFGSVVAKNNFSEYTGHGFYKVSDDIKVAGTYTYGGKDNGSWSLGGQAKVGTDITAKAKIAKGNVLSFGLKKSIVQGMTVIAGGCYTPGKATTYGVKMSIE